LSGRLTLPAHCPLPLIVPALTLNTPLPLPPTTLNLADRVLQLPDVAVNVTVAGEIESAGSAGRSSVPAVMLYVTDAFLPAASVITMTEL
jgi:hypothetical protein